MWIEYLRIAQKVLRAHKFRSFLTVLSITIGAFSIVVMSSLAESGLRTLSKGLEELGGARMMFVERKPPERAESKAVSWSKGLTIQDRDVLFGALPHVSGKSMYSSLWRRDVLADSGLSGRIDVVAADGGMIPLYKMKLGQGRIFSEEENQQHAKVCVVGYKTAEKLWGGDALGHWLTLSNTRCRVVGVLANQDRMGINMGFDWLDLVVAPYNTLADVEPLIPENASIVLTTEDAGYNEVVKRIMNSLLVSRHHGIDDFQLFDMSMFMDKFNQTFHVMKLIVGFIAGIALLVGGIGVMNMMLVSVSERVREIGIRKAIGASPSDIAYQFIWESIVLAGSGGMIGVFGGIGVAVAAGALISMFNHSWMTVVAYPAVSWALAVSVGIGVIFGFFPARRAGRLLAIEAMRR
jgi:putative ABC transport system permease protein